MFHTVHNCSVFWQRLVPVPCILLHRFVLQCASKMNIIFCETAGNGSLTSNGCGELPMGDANWGGGRIGKGGGEGDATEIMELNDINTFARYQIAFACRMDGCTLHSSLSTPVSLSLSLLLSLFLFPSHCRACLLLQYFLCRAVFLLLLLFFCFAGHGHKTSAIFKRCTWAVWFVVMPAWKTPTPSATPGHPLPSLHVTHSYSAPIRIVKA